MPEYFDSLETRDLADREYSLIAALRRQVKHAQTRAAGFARILAGVDPRDIPDRMALARLPVNPQIGPQGVTARRRPLAALS